MNVDYMEEMAREYAKVLKPKSKENEAEILSRLTVLEERQTDIIDALLCGCPSTAVRALNYLKNLIFRSLNAISVKLGAGAYIPPAERAFCEEATVAALANLQIDIFILLDKLDDPSSLCPIENRKCSIIALL